MVICSTSCSGYQEGPTEADFSRTLAEAGEILSLLDRVCLWIRTQTEKTVLDQPRLAFSEMKRCLSSPMEMTFPLLTDSRQQHPLNFFCLRLSLESSC